MAVLKQLFLVLGVLLFWAWNLAQLSLFGFALAPILFEVWESWWAGRTPLDYALSFSFFLTAPLTAVGVGVWLRRRPTALLAFFYYIELPLVALAILRAGFLRELTPGSAQWLTVATVAMMSLTVAIWRPNPVARSARLGQIFGHTSVLVVGVLLPIATAAPCIALFAKVVSEVPDFFLEVGRTLTRAVSEPWHFFTSLPSFLAVFGVLSTTALVVLSAPLAVCLVSLRSWYDAWRQRPGDGSGALATFCGLALISGSAALTWPQPHVGVLDRLEHAPSSDVEREALLADESEIREGLLDAALCDFRYLADTGTRTPQHRGGDEVWRVAMDLLFYPFLFQGQCRGTPDRASEAWTRFVDVPLQRAEAKALRHALRSTWSTEAPDAGQIDIDREQVLLEEQVIRTEPRGDLLTVTVDETYLNLTDREQEVLWAFALPASAAVHGLWLSDVAEDRERFPGVLAPRGAAQQVYREQVSVRRDPALLEQVGPQQYRLRAFPVPSAERLYVRFVYTVLRAPDASPWPEELERRNVFTNRRTVRVLDGEAQAKTEQWFAPVTLQMPEVGSHSFEVGEELLTVSPDPAAPTASGLKVALVLDTTRSMSTRAATVAEEWAQILERYHPTNDLDLYLVSGWGGAPARRVPALAEFDPADVQWFGTKEMGALLEDFWTLSGDESYDAVVFWTDAGAPQQVGVKAPVSLGAPLWLLHTGGRLPPAYDDGVLDLVTTSGGGVATSPLELFANLSVRQEGLSRRMWMDGRSFTIEPGSASTMAWVEPVAARAWILGAARQGAADGNTNLDALHRVAKASGVVTPWSSLIALVNDEQRKRLEKLEGQADRFDREAEPGQETLGTSGVPEPEEWLLLGLAGALLVFHARRRRAALV